MSNAPGTPVTPVATHGDKIQPVANHGDKIQMEIIRGNLNIKGRVRRPVVAVGNFDGLHLGHQAILHAAVERARTINGTAVALTFEPHPLTVLRPGCDLRLLTAGDEKVDRLAESGVQVLAVAAFTPSFAALAPRDFAKQVLYDQLGAEVVCVGRDFGFGHGRAGTPEVLQALGQELGFSVRVAADVIVDGTAVRSSRVRTLLEQGKVEAAARLLGRPYAVRGRVVPGDRRGTDLGVPTANIEPPPEVIPHDGVYAVTAQVGGAGGHLFKGAGYIGRRPTFMLPAAGMLPVAGTLPSTGGALSPRQIEAHLFDYGGGDLYGQEIRLTFIARLREDRAFEDGAGLALQMEQDIATARRLLTEGEGLSR